MLVVLRRSPVITMYITFFFTPVTQGTSYAYAHYPVLSRVCNGVLIDT
jgi:hypothetical protein